LQSNLREYAGPIRRRIAEDQPLGIGLWFSDSVVRELHDAERLSALQSTLCEERLVPLTINAFPQKNFHQPVVKHSVYKPDWTSTDRLEYTLAVIELMDRLLEPGMAGSISTLPLGWSHRGDASGFMAHCAENLASVSRCLEKLESRTGRFICLCLEPEPGCALTTTGDVERFFGQYLFSRPERHAIGRYIRVCHDVCHSAVMFEPQSEVLRQLRAAEIQVGKVQISSAVEARWSAEDIAGRGAVLAALRQFHEPRYLHQTTAKTGGLLSGNLEFWDDLGTALESLETFREAIARVHFHVPIFAESLGPLGTTQSEIVDFLSAFLALPAEQPAAHFEVETYAWSVLPQSHRHEGLVAGIAREIQWLQERWDVVPGRHTL
jgi:hypothetical protein